MSSDPADVDRRVTFDFGTLTNGGQTDAILTVTYRAIVLDIATNVDGASLNNSAVWSSSAGSIGPAQTTVSILEPDLTIAKTANVNFIANGSTATFTLVITHTPASNTDAFDVVVTDVLPATVWIMLQIRLIAMMENRIPMLGPVYMIQRPARSGRTGAHSHVCQPVSRGIITIWCCRECIHSSKRECDQCRQC